MKNRSYYRSQNGMATWLKVVLCIFAAGLLTVIVGAICFVSYMKDVTDPEKTRAMANKICTMVDPLPPPYEYGRLNLSLFGISGALVNNTASGAVFIVIKAPRKPEDNAKKTIDKVGKGEAGLPDASGSVPNGDGGGSKSNMNVQDQGEMDCGGTKLYYVYGKSVTKPISPPGGAHGGSDPKPVEVDTFLGAADTKDSSNETFVMGQQQDPSKHLEMEEVKNFLSCIKEI